MLKSKKKQKERSAGDHKNLDDIFPCFAGFGHFLGGTKWQVSRSVVVGMTSVLVSVKKHRRQSKARVQREAEEVIFDHTEDEASSKKVKGSKKCGNDLRNYARNGKENLQFSSRKIFQTVLSAIFVSSRYVLINFLLKAKRLFV